MAVPAGGAPLGGVAVGVQVVRERRVEALARRDRAEFTVAAEEAVKIRVRRPSSKPGLRGRAQAVVAACETGLVTPGDP